MSNIDVLIINPTSTKNVYQALGDNLTAIEPPIWAALIANYLRHKNYCVEIIDAEAEGFTVEQTTAKIEDYKPKLIAIVVYGHHPSASTQNMYAAGLHCTSIKEAYPEIKVLMVGGHVSALPARTLIEEKADFVCQGEGPYTVEGLLQIDMSDKGQYSKVPGLWYREDGMPVFSYNAPLIAQESLSEELPGMAFDMLPMDKYRAHNWHCFENIEGRQPYAALYTSLGCPFKCTFCCINAPFGKPNFRYWDPDFMIKQFDILANQYNVKNIKIADEMFVLNPSHFLKLCKLLKERNYGFNIWAYARIDTIKEEYLDVLKAAGINWLAVGIESASKFVRDGVAKGRFGENDIKDVVKRIKDSGINVMGNYIFGLPDDNLESMRDTLDMAIDLNCEMANFYSAMAYPGSQLYNSALQNGWKLPESWLGYSQHAYDALPLPTNHLSSGQVLTFRDKAWEEYFTNPKYLGLVEEKFGSETLKHIIDMTKYKLKRKYTE